jgi:uncharacterized protein YcnI
MHRSVPLAALALGAATQLALAAPLSASAHVSLETDTASPGSYDTITFRVPNESATATTTGAIALVIAIVGRRPRATAAAPAKES